MKYLVGIDEGTTGCKASVFDETGKLISIKGREYPSYYPHPGWVEQNIEEIKEAVFACCRDAVASAKRKGVDKNDIVAISHSNQGITMVLLDENEKPVRERTIGWQDLRYVDILPELQKEVDMEQSSITAQYWHGPFCYEKSTVEGEETFPMTDDGRLAMKTWLEENI